MISAKVVLHSKSEAGAEIWTLVLRYHRFIHPELMTHRKFSRNASSSRAVPAKRLLREAVKDTAVPLHWGANQAGMQASAELTGWRRWLAKVLWRSSCLSSAAHAWALIKLGLHKQVANRILEPYTHITVVVTTTNLGHFMNLRHHPAAQPEMRILAEYIYEATKDHKPQFLATGEWHLPFVTTEEWMAYHQGVVDLVHLVAASTARAARTSYNNHDGTRPDLQKDWDLTEKLVSSGHWSPTEHQAQAHADPKHISGNFDGYVQFRKMFSDEYVPEFKQARLSKAA
jgi:thymidylate synthase ThyX